MNSGESLRAIIRPLLPLLALLEEIETRRPGMLREADAPAGEGSTPGLPRRSEPGGGEGRADQTG